MKKILALILAAVMVFAFAACGGEEPAEPTNPGESTPVETSEEPAETVLSEAAQRVRSFPRLRPARKGKP